MFLTTHKTTRKDHLAYAFYSLAHDPKRYNLMWITFYCKYILTAQWQRLF